MKEPKILLICSLVLATLLGGGIGFLVAQNAKTPGSSGALGDERSKASYAIGLNIGKSMHQQSVDVDPNVLLQGLKDGLSGGKALMTDEEVRATLTAFQTEMRAKVEQKRK